MNTIYFIIFLFVVIGGPYFFLIQRRRSKYKTIAQKIKAKYISTGLLQTGKIEGSLEGKRYSIKPEVAGMGPSHHFRTLISVECKNKGLSCLVQIQFFKKFPNWKYFSKLNLKTNEADFVSTTLNKSPFTRKSNQAFSEEQKAIILKIFENLEITSENMYRAFNKKFSFETYILINKDEIILNQGGLVLDLQIINLTKNVLIDLSKCVENNPIIDKLES